MAEVKSDDQGFSHSEPDFEADRSERAHLVDAFLAAMGEAGNPGTGRKLGSFMRQLTGQQEDRFWAIRVEGDEDGVLVFADGRHGWESSFVKSDRPISPDAEIPTDQLADALRALLDENDVPRPEALR
jgi:FAD/FMN-containing dehydrogenase